MTTIEKFGPGNKPRIISDAGLKACVKGVHEIKCIATLYSISKRGYTTDDLLKKMGKIMEIVLNIQEKLNLNPKSTEKKTPPC